VVASQVKALADGEIGQLITDIQAATQESVMAIQAISGAIERLSETRNLPRSWLFKVFWRGVPRMPTRRIWTDDDRRLVQHCLD
jgi:hypothetical protein